MSEKTKRMTLWEIFKEKIGGDKEQPPELRVFNPLKARIGDFFSLEAADLAGRDFTIVKIGISKRVIDGETFEFADYIGRDGDDFVHLRIYPIPDADPFSHKHCEAVVLFPDFEMPYDQAFHEEVLPTGELEVKDGDGKVMAVYHCRNGVTEPTSAEVTVIDAKRQATERWQCWDFERDTDEGLEYYFVEMNEANHSFRMRKGWEIPEKDVMVLGKSGK